MYKLNYYQNKFKNLAIQGSAEWLEARSYSFGGSEIGTILGKNKYETWNTLLERKSNKDSFHNDSTEWGHLFEPVAKIFIVEQYGTIYEFGSIPHSYYPVCYSPDGLMVIEDQLIMIEIKNPIFRGIHSIPPAYIEQVQTGMSIISVKHCVFWQFRFRRCKLGTGPWNTVYDRVYHKEYRKRCKDMGPISYGYLYWNVDCELVDLGAVPNILDAIKDIPSTTEPQILIETEFEFKKGKVLMWKLFEKSRTIIEPEKDYLKDKEELLWSKYKELRERCHKVTIPSTSINNKDSDNNNVAIDINVNISEHIIDLTLDISDITETTKKNQNKAS